MKKLKGYISGPFMGERVPQRVQNLVIQEFCRSKGFLHLFNYSEYLIDKSTLILRDLIKDIKDVDGIVSYSLFQMPTDNTERLKIFKKIIKQKKSIFFALEDLKISTMEEIDDINNLWLIKKSLVNQKQINKNDKIFKNKKFA